MNAVLNQNQHMGDYNKHTRERESQVGSLLYSLEFLGVPLPCDQRE